MFFDFCLFLASKASSEDGDLCSSSKVVSEVLAHTFWLESRIFPPVAWSFGAWRSCNVVVFENSPVVHGRHEGLEDGY